VTDTEPDNDAHFEHEAPRMKKQITSEASGMVSTGRKIAMLIVEQRTRLMQLKQHREQLESRQIPSDAAIQKVKLEFQLASDEFEQRLLSAVEAAAHPDRRIYPEEILRDRFGRPGLDVQAFCFFLREHIFESIDDLAKRKISWHEEPLTDAERKLAIADADKKISELEREHHELAAVVEAGSAELRSILHPSDPHVGAALPSLDELEARFAADEVAPANV
jgi:hypothetical protein